MEAFPGGSLQTAHHVAILIPDRQPNRWLDFLELRVDLVKVWERRVLAGFNPRRLAFETLCLQRRNVVLEIVGEIGPKRWVRGPIVAMPP